MHFLGFFGVFLAAAAVAAPLNETPFKNAPKWTPGYDLRADDVIVGLGNGTYVVKADEYLALLKEAGVTIGPPKLDPSWGSVNTSKLAEVDKTKRGLSKRCDDDEYIITDKTETFIDWDVQMSPVLCAVGDMDITVTDGYSVSNAVTVSAGINAEKFWKVLTATFRIDYTKTWTTTASTLTKGSVKDGNCGVMITKPTTTRRSGRVFRGCIGSATEIGTWYADSHEDGSYNGIDWVQGAISMCIREQDNPPLARCNGQGNFA
ncbi:hypothetical protein NM208_g4590 [Fusarium decemcellulare]|uniref:Uncharacterized protein n=1 Tax=Fusarium decemcellulare TaxID=57161 RepID=A0ACC1SK03_9HYPO|nr:hypothetical protein NM208_g4590 [Fusarium decemcellulare]